MDIKWVNLTRVLNEFADRFIELARGNLDQNNSNATRTLYDSFEKIVEVGEDHYSVKISMEDYGKYVENGRGPGGFPPIDKIQEWVEVKPISIQPDMNGKIPSVRQVSFAIAKKIAEEGTQGKPFFEPAKEVAIREFEAAIDEAIEDDIYDYINELVIKGMNKTFGGK